MRAGDGKYAAAHVLQFFAACYAGGLRLFPDKEDRSGGCVLGRSVRVVFGGCVFVLLSVVGVSAGDYVMKIFVGYLTTIHEFRGEQRLIADRHADVLEDLVQTSKIQSTESSNRIEGIYTSDEQLRKLVLDKTKPKSRGEREIAGYFVGKYISIEKLIKQSKEACYEALADSSADWHENRNDYSFFVKYMLGVTVAAYREFFERAKIVTRHKMSKPDRIAEEIKEHIGVITKRELVQMFSDISQTTVQRTLNDLVKDGRIIKIGRGRYTKYKWNWEDEA